MSLRLTTVEKHFEILEILFDMMPFIFWKDRAGKYQGVNRNQIKNLGLNSPYDLIGKTVFEVLDDINSARIIDELDNMVMEQDITIIQEEKILVPAGEKTYLSQKSPIHNEKGEVIGMLGFSMDITELKKEQEIITSQRDKMLELAMQVVHDIKSPTASLLMLIKSCTDIPEKERISLREATMRIQDIANNLLSHYSAQQENAIDEKLDELREPIMLSTLVPVLLSEKKMQYRDLHIKFDEQFSQKGNFAFISVQPSAFKRMLSNLINNAVDALENHEGGAVMVKLDADNEWVRIVIEDNGKGMNQECIEKIKNNIAFTEGKREGHGIGLTQVRETLQRNHGEFLIESKIGSGTKITLTFARIQPPAWIAEELTLDVDDIVIILDDDSSIHGAWDTHFEPILQEYPTLKVVHFTQGQEALNYIANLSDNEKKKLFLLNDYELLKQDLNGLDVIDKSGIKRSILVTSHYADKEILGRATAMGTKILPKLLASEIPVIMRKANRALQKDSVNKLVVIDDDTLLLKMLSNEFRKQGYAVESFYHPDHFIDRLEEFPKTTKICFDYDFNLPSFNGLELAKLLYEKGYTKLYLLSGMNFKQENMPPYLILIRKDKLVDVIETI